MKYLTIGLTLACNCLAAQNTESIKSDHVEADRAYIEEVQENPGPDKVLHAEPLYIDLIRDLGARKGEREWNLGIGLTDNLKYDTFHTRASYRKSQGGDAMVLFRFAAPEDIHGPGIYQ